MRKQTIIVLAMVFLFLGLPRAEAIVNFNDGLTHDIDYEINDYVVVDYQAPGMETTANFLPLRACQHIKHQFSVVPCSPKNF